MIHLTGAGKRSVSFGIVAIALISASPMALAQDYPAKPIRFIVPLSPGGLVDVLVRSVGQELQRKWSQQAVIDNRPGANLIVGLEACAKSAADGYTLCIGSNGALTANPFLYSNLPYNVERDFEPVVNLVRPIEVLIAHPATATSVQQLLSKARGDGGGLSYGSIGEGSGPHLMIEWIKRTAGLKLNHVPYKGAAPVVTALISGEVQLSYFGLGNVQQHIKAGRIAALAVGRPVRSPLFPDVPTMAEAGLPGFVSSWFAVLAPRATPKPIVSQLASELTRIVRDPAFVEKQLAPLGVDPAGGTPEELAQLLKTDLVRAKELVRLAGARVQ